MSNKNGMEPPVLGNVNRICEGTEVKGSIKTPTDYRIDGFIEGSIACDGKVIIGDKGRVKGDIVSKNMEVSGKIEGTIKIESLLTLKASAIIDGDIITNKLIIEVGAKFNGNCQMSQQPIGHQATTTPQAK